MQTLELDLDLIKVGERQRQDYGDLDDLADSLDRYGLIQPVIITLNNELVAGGRRLAAARLLGWPKIKVCYRETLSEDERLELELEENVRRMDISWQERVLAIASIHEKKQYNNALDPSARKKWGYRETGELLGENIRDVTYALWAAERLRKGDQQVKACSCMLDVIKLMLQRKEDEVMALLSSEPSVQPLQLITGLNGEPVEQERGGHIEVKLQTYNEDAISFMRRCIDNKVQFDHIITDPPYAIDMDMIQQDNIGMDVGRTAEEHEVKNNTDLLYNFLQLGFEVTRENAFCVLWCDQELWSYLALNADDVGWRVQRWPLVWVKTDPCQNGAAQYNFTKRTEIAMVLRKPGAILNKTQASNYYICPGEDKRAFHHPFAKPLDLHKWVIEAVSMQGQTILDPFAGSGTCPVACLQLGREPIAVELKDIHYNECVENIKIAHKALHFGVEVRFI